jgi:hypothetical protein
MNFEYHELGYAMPDRIPCVSCQRIGLVRFERVIRGDHAIKSFRCFACNQSWEVAEAVETDHRRLPSKRRRPRRQSRSRT